ncbi:MULTISPECIES: serine O-acetyltransferase EpsC [unclassified Serratia (in: enterobacteria)]|uniref:serine O-acetyltransferase EpsC n=1 Tax=unclassified Serratia (in: enterobacteria) TaxID=2647522 RepID=UPI002ED4AB57|nr:serine O-acetyltransferase EpsC [Serratia sp. C2(2)]MEE4446481.1 serine O-acetyltransferase EpsC [Serratia sp. C2(1)]
MTRFSQPHENTNWQLADIVNELRSARLSWRERSGQASLSGQKELPSKSVVSEITESLRAILFPMRLGPDDLRHESEDYFVGHTLDAVLNALLIQVRLALGFSRSEDDDVERGDTLNAQAVTLVRQFASVLPAIRRRLDSDILAAYHGDPSARSVDEVLLCFPGVNAIIHHRLAHYFYLAGVPLLARLIAEKAHGETGIDIHPGAQIDDGFFIDHGTGVVIGETAIIGKRVRLYQAVTLGAKRFVTEESGILQKGQPRHPIIEDDVVIYAGATLLGRITIGKGSSIGGNVWLTRSVKPGSNIRQANIQSDSHEFGSGI